MSGRLFLYGTLCDPELFEIVSGMVFRPRPARLSGIEIHFVAGENFPVPVPCEGTLAEGVVVEVSDAVRRRLDFYELGFGYGVERRAVSTADGDVDAELYVPVEDWPLGDAWSLPVWQAEHGALSRAAARDYMGLIDTHSPEEAARAFSTVRSRAASRLRAASAATPEVFGPGMAGAQVVPERTAVPYTDYFAVREDWLAFPRFGGGTSPVVKRASFMGGDAVTVLPYDPATGEVLMIRQFRHGPFARGDANPWTLEPPAGRIDVAETPEAAARRELLEETGVEAGEMVRIGRYYPSPGAYSEYLYSFVAVADLSGADGGIGGVAEEAEDIMRHVVPLDNALGLIEGGAINTAPLLYSLTWLALNRDRFEV